MDTHIMYSDRWSDWAKANKLSFVSRGSRSVMVFFCHCIDVQWILKSKWPVTVSQGLLWSRTSNKMHLESMRVDPVPSQSWDDIRPLHLSQESLTGLKPGGDWRCLILNMRTFEILAFKPKKGPRPSWRVWTAWVTHSRFTILLCLHMNIQPQSTIYYFGLILLIFSLSILYSHLCIHCSKKKNLG